MLIFPSGARVTARRASRLILFDLLNQIKQTAYDLGSEVLHEFACAIDPGAGITNGRRLRESDVSLQTRIFRGDFHAVIFHAVIFHAVIFHAVIFRAARASNGLQDLDAIADEIGFSTLGSRYRVHKSSPRSASCGSI